MATDEIKLSITQLTKSMGKDAIPTSRAQAKRLQRAMQREMKKFEPIVKQLQTEMERLAKQDWSKPLLEAASKKPGSKNPALICPPERG
jgi:hypothetical protein